MGLLIAMLPVYLIGNFHCLGMCGPLAVMLAKHDYRFCYFLGRLSSYTLAGGLAGGAGTLLNVLLKEFHISEAATFSFGIFLIGYGFSLLFNWSFFRFPFPKKIAHLSASFSVLMLQNRALPSFLFGFFTVFLPCGQTLLVFSACALSGDVFTGLLNGFFFALLTSPSLFIAMQANSFLNGAKQHYNSLLGLFSVAIGFISLLRGLAELDLINHFVLNHDLHIVIF